MRWAIFPIFFLSGAASLVYEIVWIRQLSVVFGATTYAMATVLAVFMGGLSIGSRLFGRVADRTQNPLLVYALLEIGIGVYGFFVADLFGLLRTPYIHLYRLDLPHSGLVLGRALLVCLVLLPPTILMGGTLPVLAKFLVRSQREISNRIAMLYFVNTAGAVAGCALAGFYLIEYLGNTGTTRVAVITNFALAAGPLLLWSGLRGDRETVAPAPSQSDTQLVPLSAFAVRVTVIATGVSGFVSLAHEVLWTRALLRYVYNSTYAFSTILTVFLAGLAIGSALYPRLPLRKQRPMLLFALLEFGVAIGFVISLMLFADLPAISARFTGGEINSFSETVGMLSLSAMVVFLLPAVCLGAALPAATDICVRNNTGVGATVGTIYAVNTLGCIFGSIVATFVLIPSIGMSSTVAVLTGCTITVAALLLIAEFGLKRARIALVPVAVIGTVSIIATVRSDVFKTTFERSAAKIVGFMSGADSALVFYKEGATDTVGVLESDGQRHIMYEDMRGTASTWSYQWNFLLGHLPVLLHPGEPKTALHICFGVGNSLSATASHDSLTRIDSVELSPHVLDAAPYFWTNDNVLKNPKVNTIIDDGRNFIMATESKYDVILLEPPDTFSAGVINLYTTEFYKLVRERLNDDGIFMHWIPTGEGPLEQEKMLFRSFYEVFPEGTVWRQLTWVGPTLLISGKQPLRLDYTRVQEKMSAPRIRRDMEFCQLHTPEDIFAMFLFGPPELAKFVEGIPPVVDDRTVLDYSMPRDLGSGFGLGIFTNKVSNSGRIPYTEIFQRNVVYNAQKVSCMPYLIHYPVDQHDAIEQAILNKKLPNKNFTKPISESDWKKLSAAPNAAQ